MYAIGGGIANFGTLSVTDSTIANNSGAANYGTNGGGIENSNHGTATVTNCTIVNNSALYGGGIVDYGDALTVISSTISGNTADDGGGGIIGAGSTITLANTIIAGNSFTGRYAYPYGPDFYATVSTDLGYNLIGNTSGSSGFSTPTCSTSILCSDRWATTAGPPRPWPSCLAARPSTPAAPRSRA